MKTGYSHSFYYLEFEPGEDFLVWIAEGLGYNVKTLNGRRYLQCLTEPDRNQVRHHILATRDRVVQCISWAIVIFLGGYIMSVWYNGNAELTRRMIGCCFGIWLVLTGAWNAYRWITTPADRILTD
jgi:hypothetical protein